MAADMFTESLLSAGIRPIVESQLNGLWQSLLLVAVIWSVLRYARRISAATRHTIWAATLAAAVAMPFLSGMLASPVVHIESSVGAESSVPIESSVAVESSVPIESSVGVLEPAVVDPSGHTVISRAVAAGTLERRRSQSSRIVIRHRARPSRSGPPEPSERWRPQNRLHGLAYSTTRGRC